MKIKSNLTEPTTNDNADHCANCQQLIGNVKYCPKCGQKKTDGRISVGEFFSVFFSTVFNLESKFFQTLRDIFIPGKLTTEWFKGKHKPYFHPVRLFIVTALLLIAALSLFITDDNSFSINDSEKAQQEIYRKEFIKEIDNYNALYLKDEAAKNVLDSLVKTMREKKIDDGRKTLTNYAKKNDLPDFKDKSLEEIIANYQHQLGPELTDSLINVVKSKRLLTRDSVSLGNLVGNALKQNISNEDFLNLSPTEIADKYQIEGFINRLHFKQRIRIQKSGKNLLPFMLGNSLWVALLMMPFLAVILKLLYIRFNYFYLEHLIFSFHVHSFAFVLFASICLFLKFVYFHPFIIISTFIFLFFYLYKALRKVYKQGRLITILKLLLVNLVYAGLFFVFALFGLIMSLVLI